MLQLPKTRVGGFFAACLLILIYFPPQTGWAKGAACPSYEQLQPLLNSERIESCFGSYGVEVLRQEGRLRVSSLYSLEGGRRVTRTLAISEFSAALPDSLDDAYQAIRAGASMGATLQAAGWRVEKRQRFLGELDMAKASACFSGPVEPQDQQSLAVQVYDLYVVRERESVLFAQLAELHDPRYLTLPDLQQIDAATARQLQQPDADSEQMLQQLAEVCTLP